MIEQCLFKLVIQSRLYFLCLWNKHLLEYARDKRIPAICCTALNRSQQHTRLVALVERLNSMNTLCFPSDKVISRSSALTLNQAWRGRGVIGT
jgi:hypothetical protein